MSRFLLILLIPTLLVGCTKARQVAHLQELLTLKAVSDERDAQGKYVEAQNQRFDRLAEVVKSGQISQYPNQKKILAEFGEPVYRRPSEHNGQSYQLWLYRYATRYFDSEKVYLYFDQSGQLKEWEHYLPPANAQAKGADHGQETAKE